MREGRIYSPSIGSINSRVSRRHDVSNVTLRGETRSPVPPRFSSGLFARAENALSHNRDDGFIIQLMISPGVVDRS